MAKMEKNHVVTTPTPPDPPPEYQEFVRTRLILCVDGTKYDPNTIVGQTSIYRIYTSLRGGTHVDSVTGETVNQILKYVPVVGSGTTEDSLVNKLHTAFLGQTYHQQIQDVYEECCKLTGNHDEVVFFGFSRGAYVVRAVAGLLHHCGALASAGQQNFAKDYRKLLKGASQVYLQPSLNLSKTTSISSLSTSRSEDLRPGPKIRFVGVFDTVKPFSDDSAFDISYNTSIQHLRHALAFHEDRKIWTPEAIYPEGIHEIQLKHQGRSEIQAWFLGTHNDMGGASPKAGLALYPLQWMVLEAEACGVGFDLSPSSINNKPLSMAFPLLGGDGKPAKKATFTGANGIMVTLHDLRYVHNRTDLQGSYSISLSSGRSTSVRLKKQRSPFDEHGFLRGNCTHAPQGTIIHPSVYLLLDEHINLFLDTKEAKLQRAIEELRESMLGKKNELSNFGFWGDRALDDAPDPGAIRVLVCGNTGVGKSTLINKTFGVDVTQSSDRKRGIHDVKQEITFEGRPDLIIHDSGGFEAGADDEFKAIEEFLKNKSAVIDVKDRLHVIWFCIEINSARTLQTATEKLFQAVSTYASEVPIVVVATKKDDLLDLEFSKRRKEFKRLKQPLDEDVCDEYAEEQLRNRLDQIREEMESVPGGRLDALVAVSQDDDESISMLSKTTSQCFGTEQVRLLYIRAQVTRIDLKVDMACAEVFRRYRALVRKATGVSFTVIGPTAHRKSAANKVCKAILNCFGLPSVSADIALEALKETVWEHLGFDITIAISECLNTLGFIGTGFAGGIPAWAVTGALSAPMVVPSTCRLFLTMACDLILVLARSFKEAALRASGQPGEKDVRAAARGYRLRGYSQHVHRDIKRLIPRYNMTNCYRYGKVQQGIEDIMEMYKGGLMDDIELPLDVKRFEKASKRKNGTGQDSDDDGDDDDSAEAGSAFYKELQLANKKAVELDANETTLIPELESNPIVELEATEKRAELDGAGTAVIELEATPILPHRRKMEALCPKRLF